MKKIKLTINNETLSDYEKFYFEKHPRAHKKPIPYPYHESINVWMIMHRPEMNAWKQKWKDFIVWYIDQQGYTNLRIEKCELRFAVYYPNNRRHDVDNSCPKAILDGLVESGFIVDDDSVHLTRLTLECFVDIKNPRTEITVCVKE